MKVLVDTDILSELYRDKSANVRARAASAGDIGGALVRAGRTIGVVDVGLAATAIRHDRVLVSGNTAHRLAERRPGEGRGAPDRDTPAGRRRRGRRGSSRRRR